MGSREEFFKLLSNVIPLEIQKKDSTFQKTEFYLMVYFSIFPLHPNNPTSGDYNKLNTEMNQFKVYLETKGAQLSKTPEFLSFYALPFIRNLQVFLS
jgi:hypothetical protein